jgi:hypothetical protein
MAKSYYYLVAGLPDLLMDEGKNVPSFLDLLADIEEQVTAEDFRLIDCIRLQFDNVNLACLLDSRTAEFDPRGLFSRDTLLSGIKYPDQLPGYMQQFIEARKDNRVLFAGLTTEDQLNWLLFEWLSQHKHPFIREWASFELALRNVLSGINTRKGLEHLDDLGTERERPVQSLVVGRDDVAEMVLRSTAPDFGVAPFASWVDRVIAGVNADLLESEKNIDALRWDIIGEMAVFAYFTIDSVIAFLLKLLIVERWKKLDPAQGKARLDRLVDELKSGFTVPAGF